MCTERFDPDQEVWVTDDCDDPTHSHSSTYGAAQHQPPRELAPGRSGTPGR